MLMLREEGLDERVMGTLKRAGVIKLVHCVGSSGKHLDMFIDFEGVFDNPGVVEEVGFIVDRLAAGIVNSGLDPEVVMGPADGGNKLSERLAPVLAQKLGHPVRMVRTSKLGKEGFTIDGDESDLKGCRTLVVDDVSTSGGSGVRTAKPAQRLGANIIGFVVVVDRERLTAEKVDLPFYGCLIQVNARSWKDKTDCEQGGPCGRGEALVPVNSHTIRYLEEHGQPIPRIGIAHMT